MVYIKTLIITYKPGSIYSIYFWRDFKVLDGMIEGLRVLFMESQILLRDCVWGDSRIDECACPHELKMRLSSA